MSDHRPTDLERLAELERWRAATDIALEQLRRDLEARSVEDDVERGRLFASLARQLKTMLDQIEPLRLDLAKRLEAQEKYDDLNELRFDVLRSEIRRLDQQLRESENGRDSWHETTGMRELEELSARARHQRSVVPPPFERRARDPSSPEITGRHSAIDLDVPPAPPAEPKPAPPTTPPPTTTAQAGVQLARIVFADQSVVVRFVAVLALLVFALTALLLAVRAALPALLE